MNELTIRDVKYNSSNNELRIRYEGSVVNLESPILFKNSANNLHITLQGGLNRGSYFLLKEQDVKLVNKGRTLRLKNYPESKLDRNDKSIVLYLDDDGNF